MEDQAYGITLVELDRRRQGMCESASKKSIGMYYGLLSGCPDSIRQKITTSGDRATSGNLRIYMYKPK